MNGFLKGVPSTVNSNTKIVKIFSIKKKKKIENKTKNNILL